VLAFAGFGVLIGAAGGSRSADTQAAVSPALKLVIPPTHPTSSSAATTPQSPPALPAETSTPSGGSTSENSPSTEQTTTKQAPSTSNPPSSPAGSSNKQKESPAKSGAGKNGAGGASKLPAIKHVFVIMLDDQPYATVFGPSSQAPYLAHTLEKKGALLVRYYAVAHEQLANEVALLSGQGPTEATAANCPTYTGIAPPSGALDGQVLGQGCVYPGSTRTLMNQLIAKHLTWRAYLQGADEGGSTPPACSHPQPGAGDPTATATSFATFSNPFVYFESITGSSECTANDVGLSQLKADLADAKKTPNFSYIAPNLCDDGSPAPCRPGKPAGMPAADGFLASLVPEILHSKAYKQNGLLVITTSEAPSKGEFADSSSCCGQPIFPNLPKPSGGLAAVSHPGGGEVGALLLSPYVKSGQISQEPLNHFALLRTIEDLFGLEHIGYAASKEVKALAPSLFQGSK